MPDGRRSWNEPRTYFPDIRDIIGVELVRVASDARTRTSPRLAVDLPRRNARKPHHRDARAAAAAPTVLLARRALDTLTKLSRQTPVAILAEALGYRPETLEKHAAVSGADYGLSVSDLRTD